jgi:poly(3-hydroxybutyrate) depolymerase
MSFRIAGAQEGESAGDDGTNHWHTGLATSFSGAQSRATTLQFPNAYDSRKAYPLFILLHQLGASGSNPHVAVQTNLNWLKLKNRGPRGALVLVPLGAVNGNGDHWWNSCEAMDSLEEGTPNDVDYLGALIDEVIAEGWAVDPQRIIVVGQSAGGFMAHRLAVERSDVVTHCIAISGVFPSLTTAEFSPLDSPVNVVHMHGTLDDSVLYAGDPTNANATDVPDAAYPGAIATGAAWNTLNGGAGTLQAAYGAAKSYDALVAGDETTRQAYSSPADNGEVEVWTMTGSAHGLTLTQLFTDDIEAWIDARPRT